MHKTKKKLKTKRTQIFLLAATAVFVFGMGFSNVANAQAAQCKIAGTADATFSASITSYDREKGTVEVSAQNDSEKTVTGTVTVKWGNESKTVTILVPRESESSKTITFSQATVKDVKLNAWNPTISVTSAKCN
ncbi:MAG: hypothetical protein LBR17_00400 [Bacteroidales bacterium]|jgi:hypothetical protein|nr:hypothetical protein [Bacteroidales bacterium]